MARPRRAYLPALPLTIVAAIAILTGGGVAAAASPAVHVRAAATARQAHAEAAGGPSGSAPAASPQLTYTLSSRHRPSRYGWYRSPVTIHFRCQVVGATLIGSCPAPVTVSRSARTTVRRTIHSSDGGSGLVVVTLKIDRTRPRAWAAGVVNGQLYRRSPPLRCRARDRISGIASCRVFKRVVISGDLSERVVHYRLVATNRAGSRGLRRGSYRLAGI